MNAGYNGQPIRFFQINNSIQFFRTRKRIKKEDICPICMQAANDKIFLVISNQAGIPNRILHQECVINEDETIARLASLYEEAKAKHKEFAPWF